MDNNSFYCTCTNYKVEYKNRKYWCGLCLKDIKWREDDTQKSKDNTFPVV